MNDTSHNLGATPSHSSAHEQAHVASSDGPKPLDWRRRMSDHVAWALVVYTILQIFMTVKALAEGFSSILPYIALVILVAAIIPACRWFEKRWTGLSDADAGDPAFADAFRRDTIGLWLMAIMLPLTLTAIFKVIFAAM